MLDKDGDGYIEEKELAEMIGYTEGFNSEALKKLIEEVDVNGDNKIDFNEFEKMITSLSA
jgi:Ca2+-binding EF-hand superfamily protein